MSEQTGPYDPHELAGVRMGGNALHHGLNKIEETASQETSAAPVRVQLAKLEGGMETLEAAIAHLVDRLEPVLPQPVKGTGVSGDAQPADEAASPLHGYLQRHTRRVRRLTDRVKDVVAGLTI